MSILLKNICKTFEKKIVLKNINAEFSFGKIYSIVGENGAGKSTLIKIISQKILPDENSKIDFTQNEKIKIVEQSPLVADSLSIKQNIFLGKKENRKSREKLNELIKTFCPSININMLCKNAPSSVRFYTSFLNCLLSDFNVLILDEPTAYLDDDERKVLFSSLNELKKKGVCVIVVTHSKKEILNYADEILLLKKGVLAQTFFDVQKKSSKEKNEILKQIESSISAKILTKDENNCTEKIHFKNSLNENFLKNEKIQNPENENFKIQFKNISCINSEKPLIKNISFSVENSQIVMITGLSEAGLFTLEDCITGFSKINSGEILFEKNSKKIIAKKVSPRFLRKTLQKKLNLKIAIVASDKKNRAAALDFTVAESLYSANLDFSKISVIEKNQQIQKKSFCKKFLFYVNSIIKNSELKISSNDKIKTLSGGMLQRLILERELFFDPDFLILCEPFAGLDMQKKKIILEKILKLKRDGKSVLILSTEKIEENIFDKIYKLDGGKIYD